MQKVFIITGPTASGKSARALDLARSCGGTIINADAMQCYTPLPLLSAQPTTAEREEIPHRMYGILAVDETLNAARWADLAKAEIAAVLAAGRVPILCGGSGLYLRALTQGVAKMPDIDPAVRDRLRNRLLASGLPDLYAELMCVDSVLADRLMPGDTQRILRGLEVWYGTGRRLSEWQQDEHHTPPEYDFMWEIILPAREILYEKINARTHHMIAAGVLDEVRMACIPPASTAYKTHGYREFLSHLRGEISLQDAIAQTQQVTRNYAKRQFTWCKNQLGAPAAG